MLGDTAVAVNPDDERYAVVCRQNCSPAAGGSRDTDHCRRGDRSRIRHRRAQSHARARPGRLRAGQASRPRADLDFRRHRAYQRRTAARIAGCRARKRASKSSRTSKPAGLARKDRAAQARRRRMLAMRHRRSSRCSPSSGSCSMRAMADRAIEAVRKGDTTFHPKRWENVFFNWLENIHDWCISRQLWWGHRIPAYRCVRCDHLIVAAERPSRCPECDGSDIVQDDDVLDTWFSSGLWPMSTLGWPEYTPDFERYYPDQPAAHGLRHNFFLGRAHDDVRARVHRQSDRSRTCTSRRWCATSSARK